MKSRPSRQFELQLDAERQDLVDLGADEVARQAVLGHALVQHAADDRCGVEQRHAVAEQREVVRAADPRRAGADDRHPRRPVAVCGGEAAAGAGAPAARQRVLDAVPLGQRALEGANRDRLVDVAAAAFRLARVRADAAADRGERVGRPGDGVAALGVPLGNRPDVGARVRVDRARRPAGNQVQEVPEVGNDRRVRAVGHGGLPRQRARAKSTVAGLPASTVTGFGCAFSFGCQTRRCTAPAARRDLEVPFLAGHREVRVLQHDDEAFHLRVDAAELRVDAGELRALREDVVLGLSLRPRAEVVLLVVGREDVVRRGIAVQELHRRAGDDGSTWGMNCICRWSIVTAGGLDVPGAC